MNAIYHELTAFCVLVIAIIWLSGLVTQRFVNRSYFYLNTTMLLFGVVDEAWGLFLSGFVAFSHGAAMLTGDLYFILLVLSVTMLAHYLAAAVKGTKIAEFFRTSFLTLFVATAVLVVVNRTTGILYTIDAAGQYARGPAFSAIYLGVIVLYTLLLVPILRTSREQRERMLLILAYSIPLLITFVQYFFPEIPFFSMAFTVSLIGIALTVEYQQRKLLVDALNAAEHANRAKTTFLSNMSHDIRTIVNANIVSKNIEFFIDAVDVENEDILCDKLRLNQVLLNLLSNATKFTKNGGQIVVRIIQKPCRKNGYATYEFHVKDNGIGMSKAFQEHLFEAFTREETATVSGIQGTGLGMAITKNIVDMMGGTITVESEEGKGTEYTVSIPFKVLGKSAKYEVVPQLKGVRVLVADDDSDTAISVSRMVQEIGMRSEWTLSGKEAVLRTKVAVEQNDAFGAYIIDWMMPDLNGIETVRRIRKLIGDSKPIIILTAYDWSDVEQEAREAGVTAFCSKPLFLSELRDVLSQPYRVKPEPASAPKFDVQGKKVLLVEDNPLNQEIARSVLEEHGVRVQIADDGDVAVELLRNTEPGRFDLVLMDIQMPKMDGYTATRQIRTLPGEIANIPIIAMTANAFEEDRQKAIQAGMNAHIAKPIEVDKLLSTMMDVLH